MVQSDVGQVASIEVRAWQTAYRGIIHPETLRGMSPENLVPRWNARVAESPSSSWVCANEGDILGYSVIGPCRDRDLERGFAGEVFALYVDPVIQGHGVGRMLLNRSFEELEGMGFLWGVVWVLEANTSARAFYQRCGLTDGGVLRRTRMGRQRLSVIRYERPLNDLDPFGVASSKTKAT